MDYFGDAETLPKGCGRCDNCQTPDAKPVDGKTQETVRILLSGAARLDGRFGGSQLADLVTGSDTAQIRRYDHDQLPTYGRLSSMSKRQVQAMIQALIRQGYLRQEGLRYPVLAITAEGREVMHNRAVARLGYVAAEPSQRRPRIEPPSGQTSLAPFQPKSMPSSARRFAAGDRQGQRDGRSALYAFLGPNARRTVRQAPGHAGGIAHDLGLWRTKASHVRRRDPRDHCHFPGLIGRTVVEANRYRV